MYMIERTQSIISPELVRIHFEPSDELRDAFGGFYNKKERHRVGQAVLRSTASFRVTVFNNLVRPYPYSPEDQSLPTVGRRMDAYGVILDGLKDHALPVAEYFRSKTTPHGALRISMAVHPKWPDRVALGTLSDIDIGQSPNIETFLIIPPTHRENDKNALWYAASNLMSQMGLENPSFASDLAVAPAANNPVLYVRRPDLIRGAEPTSVDPSKQ
jgi:hypothetical protein